MGSQPAGRQPVGRQPAGRHRHHKDHRVDLFADKLKNLKRERKLQKCFTSKLVKMGTIVFKKVFLVRILLLTNLLIK